MVLKPGPIFRAVEALFEDEDEDDRRMRHSRLTVPIILLTPQGRPFTQTIAQELAQHAHLVLLCGRYEGVDERVRQHLVTDEISIGDYVLTGGELAALVLVDAVARLLPDVLGAEGAAETDSYATGLLEGPHYTRPASFRGWDVPEVLRSGHAANIARWRRQQALRRTWQRRPDLLLTAPLTEEDKWFLAELAREAVRTAGSSHS
jgi:tRNA (guanine37-N1)-methyltransferase